MIVTLKRLALGRMLTFGIFALSLLGFFEVAWAAPIACTGSSSGSAGTCSTIANCSGTAETPASRNSNGGPVAETCPDEWICCIAAASGGTKPPKPPIEPPTQPVDPLPPADPGNNPGAGSCGGGNGTCVNAASECNGSVVADSACSMCCLGSVGAPINECTNVGGRCATINGGCTTSETSSTRSCNDATRTCCMPSTTGGTSSGAGAACAGGNGTCATIANCTGFTPVSDPVACGSDLICCPDGGPSTGGTGGTTTTTGSLTCATGYQKVAGVCFPKGTGLSEKSVLEIIAALISWLLAIFGFIALLGFIISGIQYLLSTGDEGMAETAKRNMKYSIIGIIVALSGWIIIKAVDALLNASTLI